MKSLIIILVLVFEVTTQLSESFLISTIPQSNRLDSTRSFGEYVGQPKEDLTCDPTIEWDHIFDTEENVCHGGKYAPGRADTEFARKYEYFVGKEIKTVSESLHDFYKCLGHPILSYYKTMVADLIETTHLALFNARFKMDPIWSLGLVYNLDELLKNYPDSDIAQKIKHSVFVAFDLSESKIRSEAKLIEDAVEKHKSLEEITRMFDVKEASLISEIVKTAKDDNFWMYHRFFGFGLIKIMSMLGIDVSDENEPIMEAWVVECMGKKDLSSRVYSDCREWRKRSEKLDLMRKLLTELEIREKKRKAQRLEEKTESMIKQSEELSHFAEFDGISHRIE